MSETMLEGGCLCGRVRYRVTGKPLVSEYCHCGMCRKATGAPVAAWADFPRTAFRWLTEPPADYSSSERSLRSFCSNCGGALTFRLKDGTDWISIALGSLDEPGAVPPAQHIYHASRVRWLTLNDDLPRHEARVGEGK